MSPRTKNYLIEFFILLKTQLCYNLENLSNFHSKCFPYVLKWKSMIVSDLNLLFDHGRATVWKCSPGSGKSSLGHLCHHQGGLAGKKSLCSYRGCVGRDDGSKILEQKASDAGVNVKYQYSDKPTGRVLSSSRARTGLLSPSWPLPTTSQSHTWRRATICLWSLRPNACTWQASSWLCQWSLCWRWQSTASRTTGPTARISANLELLLSPWTRPCSWGEVMANMMLPGGLNQSGNGLRTLAVRMARLASGVVVLWRIKFSWLQWEEGPCHWCF